jgi:hypothetical protein
MARQYQVPGGRFVNETGTKKYQVPGGAYQNESVAAGGNTIAVPLGTLTLTGQVPTIVQSANNVIAVPLGTLTLTGQTPTVVQSANQIVNVPLGTLTLTGQTPTIIQTANNVIAVPLATLVMAGLAPTIPGSTSAGMPVGGVSARVWRQGIQTYLRRIEAESEPEVRAEIKQVKAQAKKSIELIRDTGTLPPIPKLVVKAPDLQFLVERANADILAKAEAELMALEDEEDAIYVLLH